MTRQHTTTTDTLNKPTKHDVEEVSKVAVPSEPEPWPTNHRTFNPFPTLAFKYNEVGRPLDLSKIKSSLPDHPSQPRQFPCGQGVALPIPRPGISLLDEWNAAVAARNAEVSGTSAEVSTSHKTPETGPSADADGLGDRVTGNDNFQNMDAEQGDEATVAAVKDL